MNMNNQPLASRIPAADTARFATWLEFYKGVELDEVKSICLAPEGEQHVQGKRLFCEWFKWCNDMTTGTDS